MEKYFRRALLNIVKHGDTDIFPLPIENHIFYDKHEDTAALLADVNKGFQENLARYAPNNHSALAPVNYTGFRWATQLDPLWNAYFLGLTLSIAEPIERARVAKSQNCVFSYRYLWDETTADIFDKSCNWRAFMEHSQERASSSKFVVTCDISEFYPRLGHHRLENALKQLHTPGDEPKKIMDFLSNFSGTNSYGLPIGGPASRLLSEILLDQVDRLLLAEGIRFCRFADDYHLFGDDYESAFKSLLLLSEKLLLNQGLQLQKSKTRIMSGQEFIATSPIKEERSDRDPAGPGTGSDTRSQSLLRFSIRFDPYSPTAEEDYEALKKEIKKYDILSLLKSELSKSRVHISLSRKIISAIRFIDPDQKDDAVLSLIENGDLLYPVYSNVLLAAKMMYDQIQPETQKKVIAKVLQLIRDKSHVLQVELNLAYAVRLLSMQEGPEQIETLNKIFRDTRSVVIRRDIILIMAKWRAWYWLSDLKSNFRTLTPTERRAFLIASYGLSDEGKHWREHMNPEFTPFEKLVKAWAAEKKRTVNWSIPI